MKNLEDKYENVVYIPVNELGLSFNPLNFPKELEDSLEEEEFESILREVNAIIER